MKIRIPIFLIALLGSLVCPHRWALKKCWAGGNSKCWCPPRRWRSAGLMMSTERISSLTWGQFDCGLLLLRAWRLGSYPLPASTGWCAGWPRICWRRMLSTLVKLSHKRDPSFLSVTTASPCYRQTPCNLLLVTD